MGSLAASTVFYILLVMALSLLSLAVFIRRATRTLAGACIAHLAVSLLGLLYCFAEAAMLAVSHLFSDTEDLGGFWVGLIGFIISLIGSIWMLVDCLRAPKE
jgi:hypothetical protein